MQQQSNSVPENNSAPMVPSMEWHQRLNEKLRELGWSVPDLAKQMGHAGDVALIEKLYKYVGGKVENPRGSMLTDIATAINMSETELRTGKPLTIQPGTTPQNGVLGHNAIIGGNIGGFVKIPIRGQGMGGKDGSLVFNTDQNLGDIIAPPSLSTVPGAYAVYVVGDSMLERFRAGEVVYVHPYQPVRKGDDCVIQILMPDGERHGWIKRFVSMDAKNLRVCQLHPRKFITFAVKKVVSVHKIIMAGPV